MPDNGPLQGCTLANLAHLAGYPETGPTLAAGRSTPRNPSNGKQAKKVCRERGALLVISIA